jgi:23S rRNA pseudouridine2605 synthase
MSITSGPARWLYDARYSRFRTSDLRLQKLLAGAGLGSRRAIEDWIRAGRISVNGRTAQLGDRAEPGDDVRVDGKPVAVPAAEAAPHQLLIYNKPLDEVTTRSDPQGRRTVFESLPPTDAGRWISIGRLDVNTSGLLLFTTDGELAHRLMHPSGEVEREYRVAVRGQPTPEAVRRLREGVMLEDGPARFDRIEAIPGGGADATFKVVLREGRNREVRRMWQTVGHEVVRLTRTRYGPVELPPDLPMGKWRRLPIEMIAGVAVAR